MSGKRRTVLLVIVLAAVAFLSVMTLRQGGFRRKNETAATQLPLDGEIVSMQAAAYQCWASNDPIPEFDVPSDRISGILYWFREGGLAKAPPSEGDLLGELKIRTKQGAELHVKYYWVDKGPVVFTRNGSIYFTGRRDESDGLTVDCGMRVAGAVEAAYKETNAKRGKEGSR
jgi:hypothetical protein